MAVPELRSRQPGMMTLLRTAQDQRALHRAFAGHYGHGIPRRFRSTPYPLSTVDDVGQRYGCAPGLAGHVGWPP